MSNGPSTFTACFCSFCTIAHCSELIPEHENISICSPFHQLSRYTKHLTAQISPAKSRYILRLCAHTQLWFARYHGN